MTGRDVVEAWRKGDGPGAPDDPDGYHDGLVRVDGDVGDDGDGEVVGPSGSRSGCLGGRLLGRVRRGGLRIPLLSSVVLYYPLPIY